MTAPIAVHTPVLLDEVLEYLFGPSEIEGTVLDATFGRGGHSRAIANRMSASARLLVMDRDPEAIAAAREFALQEPRVTVLRASFSELEAQLHKIAAPPLSAVLMDIGVSSPQLDTGIRGFSFRQDAELDMRMDPDNGESAASWLNRTSEKELVDVLQTLGEARFARRIASAIIAARPIYRTLALADVVAAAVPKRFYQKGIHPATQTFMAIRMQVNDELAELEAGLRQAYEALAPGGRLGVISFHSIETRMVKRFFRRCCQGEPAPRHLPLRTSTSKPEARRMAGPVLPGAQEIRRNPRSRSAVLRVLERCR